MPATASNAPTTADLTAAFIASGKTVTVCPPANAVPPSPQSAPVVPAKTAKRVKAAVAKTLKAVDAPQMTTKGKAAAARSEQSANDKAAARNAKRNAPKSTPKSGAITLASICAEIDMSPKAARAILRRKMTKPAEGWSFDKKGADAVRVILTAK